MTDPSAHAALAFDEVEVHGSIIERLRRVAELLPDAPALSDGSAERSTFLELWTAVRAAGQVLCAEQLDAGRPVGILMPHRPVAIASQLAALAAGLLVTPLDHLAPADALKGYLDQADPELVICHPGLEELLRSTGFSGKVLLWSELPTAPADAPELLALDGSRPAYLLFTSGSTGAPKGAVTLHGAFLRPAREICNNSIYGPGDRVGLAAPLPFMVAVDTMLWAMLSGAELCTFSVREQGPQAFVQWMAAARITGWGTAVAALRAMAAGLSNHPLPALRLVMVGGEVLHADDVPVVRAMSSTPLDIVPVYASTEIPLVAWQHIRHDDEVQPGTALTLGRPVEGTTVGLRALADGDPTEGEIVVESPIGSAGYWRQPELTDRHFTFDVERDSMTYATSDVGRRTKDGQIEVVGRTDSMVKVRGFQVHLSVVEAAVRGYPGVTNAVILALPTGRGDLALVAHVAGEPDGEPLDATAIRTMLRRNLPAHMVPASVVVHEQLPMTDRGKVDRPALERLGIVTSGGSGRPPATPTEREILEEWRVLLGRDDIGVDDDFFEVGGDSMLAVQLLVYLENRFGLWQPLSTWMDATTVEAIAATIDASPGRGLERLTRIQPGDGTRPPLVVAYDLHGGAFRFKRFGEALGPDQELWGLENPMLDGTADMPRTLEDLAAVHVGDLVARFGRAPIHLVGYSASGAFLVVEIARQLLESGAQLGYLCLVDFGPVHLRHGGRPRSYRPPGAWPERPPSDQGVLRRARSALDEVRSADRGRRLARLSRLVDAPRLHDLTAARVDLWRRGRVRPELRTATMWYRTMDALVDYEFRPLDASATLLVSDQTAKGNIAVSRRLDYASLTDPQLGWGGLFRSIDTRKVIGHHNDLMEDPYVEGVAGAVRGAFDDWLDAHGPGR